MDGVQMNKILTVYFSYTGNTKKVADKIHEKMKGDIVRIEPVKSYAGDYNDVVNQGHQEVNCDYLLVKIQGSQLRLPIIICISSFKYMSRFYVLVDFFSSGF